MKLELQRFFDPCDPSRTFGTIAFLRINHAAEVTTQ